MLDAKLMELAAEVRRDFALDPKQLQSRYLYDALGSSLFEAICRLPWYRITRAELGLLERYGERMVAALESEITVAELGGGSGQKAAILLAAIQRRQPAVLVHLVDISSSSLASSQRTLAALGHVSVIGHRATYEAGLRSAAAGRASGGSLLVLFLGSNIGNFDPAATHVFLESVRGSLRPGDALLLGADLVKPEAELLLAYDDPLGVTAAFNKNLLLRLNTDLGANFDLAAFAHRALFNTAASRVEMHLVSSKAQTADLPLAGISVDFAKGEPIWTESSYKYEPPQIVAMAAAAGFHCAEQWIDPGARFATSLLIAE